MQGSGCGSNRDSSNDLGSAGSTLYEKRKCFKSVHAMQTYGFFPPFEVQCFLQEAASSLCSLALFLPLRLYCSHQH